MKKYYHEFIAEESRNINDINNALEILVKKEALIETIFTADTAETMPYYEVSDKEYTPEKDTLEEKIYLKLKNIKDEDRCGGLNYPQIIRRFSDANFGEVSRKIFYKYMHVRLHNNLLSNIIVFRHEKHVAKFFAVAQYETKA